MLRRVRIWRVLSVLATLACVAGCTTGSTVPSLTALSPASIMHARPDAQHYGNDWLYATTPGTGGATVYRRKGTTLKYYKTLSVDLSSPQGSVVTPTGWWYVTNSGDGNVLIYRSTSKGPSGPTGTPLDDSGEVPVNVALTRDRDLVAVSNVDSTQSGTGSVNVYLDRATEPSRTLRYGTGPLVGNGIAIDRNGNCYWSVNGVENGSIVEFSQCQGTGTVVVSVITIAGGLAFDRSGDLYYIDEARGIYKCQGTSDCKLFATGFGTPVTMNFDADDKHLWVADATGYLDAVNPQTGQLESQSVSVNGDPFGIAPSPGS